VTLKALAGFRRHLGHGRSPCRKCADRYYKDCKKYLSHHVAPLFACEPWSRGLPFPCIYGYFPVDLLSPPPILGPDFFILLSTLSREKPGRFDLGQGGMEADFKTRWSLPLSRVGYWQGSGSRFLCYRG